MGFLLGAVAGAWAASKATQLKQGSGEGPTRSLDGLYGDDAAEKLRAITGLARERIFGLIESPFVHH